MAFDNATKILRLCLGMNGGIGGFAASRAERLRLSDTLQNQFEAMPPFISEA